MLKVVFGGGQDIFVSLPINVRPKEVKDIERQIVESYTAIHILMNTGILCSVFGWGET